MGNDLFSENAPSSQEVQSVKRLRLTDWLKKCSTYLAIGLVVILVYSLVSGTFGSHINQSMIDEEANDIQDAFMTLVSVESDDSDMNFSAYNVLKRTIEKIKESDYTIESWMLYELAIVDVDLTLNPFTYNVNQEIINAQTVNIKAALAKLVPNSSEYKYNFIVYDAFVGVVADLKESDYTSASWIHYSVTLGYSNLMLGSDAFHTKKVFESLCDTFLIVAVIFLALAGFKYVSSKGALDGATYSARVFTKVMKVENYDNYVQSREEKRKTGRTDIIPLLISGIVFLIGSIIFLILHNNI